MPKLNEYLGSIVSGIVDARVMSDIQAVKVAQEYANHPWLQHFAVPRMRIEDVELTIPVALESLNERSETTFEPLDTDKFRKQAQSLVTRAFGISNLGAKQKRLLQDTVSLRAKQLDSEMVLTRSLDPVKGFTRSLSSFLIENAKEFGIEETVAKEGFDPDKIHAEVNETLIKGIKPVSEKTSIESLNVVVEADKLREKNPQNMVIIKMKITEQGMEWQQMETSAGKIESKLLPE